MDFLKLIPLAAVLYGLLVKFGLLPATATETQFVAVIALILNGANGIVRFNAGEYVDHVKSWWESKIIVTNIAGAVFAVTALFGVSLGFTVEGAVEIVMIIVGLASFVFARKPQAAIA
jgi:hypothetical protein